MFHRLEPVSGCIYSFGSKSTAFGLLILNLFLFVITAIAAWAINHGIERSHDTAAAHMPPARLFPIFFPIGNKATGFVVIFSLIAGAQNITMSASDVYAAAGPFLIALSLSLLVMGLARSVSVGKSRTFDKSSSINSWEHSLTGGNFYFILFLITVVFGLTYRWKL